jgi:hypothetical protein
VGEEGGGPALGGMKGGGVTDREPGETGMGGRVGREGGCGAGRNGHGKMGGCQTEVGGGVMGRGGRGTSGGRQVGKGCGLESSAGVTRGGVVGGYADNREFLAGVQARSDSNGGTWRLVAKLGTWGATWWMTSGKMWGGR